MTSTAEPPPAPAAPEPVAPAPGGPSRRSALVLRVAGLLVTLVLLLAGAGFLVGQFFAQQRTETTTIDQRVVRLVARTDAGNVRIRQGAAGAPVRVTRTLHWSFQEPRASIVVGGGLLTATSTCGSGLWPGICSTDLDVVVPPGVALDLRTDIGNVVASGTAAVAVRTTTGNVTLTVPGSPSVEVRTDAGNVAVTGGGADARIRADTSLGQLRLALAQAPAAVHARTGTGNIVITVPRGDSYQTVATTDSGDARVGVPIDASSRRVIDAKTGTGNVTVQAL